ncbi:hypothetical protein KP509_18G012700 [Ceratopteris richardii]|uniref:Uncharacterized protein n=1 Tax=Ceratopteris richardii TaxID=49495 RepID=A0A8T2SS24_CERRI|nr:hypothetical protein KP509_18G012700 [Ceratopteris richardii]
MNPPRLSHVQLQLSLSLDEPLSSANSFYHEEPCSLRCAHNDAIGTLPLCLSLFLKFHTLTFVHRHAQTSYIYLIRFARLDAAHVCVYEREKHSSLSVQVLFFFDRGTSHVAVVEHGGASLQGRYFAINEGLSSS